MSRAITMGYAYVHRSSCRSLSVSSVRDFFARRFERVIEDVNGRVDLFRRVRRHHLKAEACAIARHRRVLDEVGDQAVLFKEAARPLGDALVANRHRYDIRRLAQAFDATTAEAIAHL